jgi:hypothetical protein
LLSDFLRVTSPSLKVYDFGRSILPVRSDEDVPSAARNDKRGTEMTSEDGWEEKTKWGADDLKRAHLGDNQPVPLQPFLDYNGRVARAGDHFPLRPLAGRNHHPAQAANRA